MTPPQRLIDKAEEFANKYGELSDHVGDLHYYIVEKLPSLLQEVRIEALDEAKEVAREFIIPPEDSPADWERKENALYESVAERIEALKKD